MTKLDTAYVLKDRDFSTWTQENLANFATQVWLENEALRQDLRVALDAYRREVNT